MELIVIYIQHYYMKHIGINITKTIGIIELLLTLLISYIYINKKNYITKRKKKIYLIYFLDL